MSELLCEIREYSSKAKRHQHGYGQLILPVKGKLQLSTDNNDLVLDENHMFFLPPDTKHTFSSSITNKFIVVDIPEEKSILVSNKINEEFYDAIDNRWRGIKHLLTEETKINNPESLEKLVDYMLSLFNQKSIPISVQYIHKNFHEKINLKILAKLENYSETYYVGWFYKTTGSTPYEYIQKYRLKKAKEYLIHTDENIIVIADMVGYVKQSSLNRLFNRYNEISPMKYRKEHKEKIKTP
jgi:AraC-like DNA-binding protein